MNRYAKIRTVLSLLSLLAAAQPVRAEAEIRLFKAESTTIVEGQGTMLVWEVKGAKSVRIEPGIGVVKAKGSVPIKPTLRTTYELFVEGLSSTAKATVMVEASGQGPGEQGLGLGRLNVRVLLLQGTQPKDGLGLYSYVLFGDTPNAQTRPIYLQVLHNIAKVPDLSSYKDMDPKRINGIHIPLTRNPATLTAAELLECYDFATAKAILMALGEQHHLPGPYLISTLKPVNVHKEQARPYLLENLTAAPPNVVDPWVAHFLSQAVQETPWDTPLLEKLAAGLSIQLAKLRYHIAAITVVR